MNPDIQLKVLANFLLDSAKIIFGSAVVGALVPGLSKGALWLTAVFGLIATIAFLTAAMRITKIAETSQL